ncbi:19237_t:CDS:2, partial [Funneliformis geosporum]
LESSSDKDNFDDIFEPDESTEPIHKPLICKSITRHYKPSKKLKFNRKTGVFQQECLRIYSWLIYDASKKLMFCSICKAHKMSNRFVKEGSKNMKASTPAEHFTSDNHTQANNLKLAKVQMKKVTNNAINKTYEHTCSLMKIVFWLAKNDVLLNKFPSVIQLGRALESPKIISNTNSITYENPVSGIISKITSFASDEASVMLGKMNGVATKIAERNSYLFTTHCIAYRLALA